MLLTKKLGAAPKGILSLLIIFLYSQLTYGQGHEQSSRSSASWGAKKRVQGTASSPRSTFITIANQMLALDTHYTYGGKGPRGWDCSNATTEMINRTLSALGKDRISYRTSGTYRSYLKSRGLKISCSNAKPGDIIGWSGHVGLVYDSSNLVSSHSSSGISKANFKSGWASKKAIECYTNPWF